MVAHGRAAASAAFRSADPGRLGLTAYTYLHIPMVAGVIAAAAADELTLAHPKGQVDTKTAAVILIGPALYLLGTALFKWALWGHLGRSRVVALLALCALIPLAFCHRRSPSAPPQRRSSQRSRWRTRAPRASRSA